MGKNKKIKVSRYDPIHRKGKESLEESLSQVGAKPSIRNKTRSRAVDDEEFISGKDTGRILKQVCKQRKDLDDIFDIDTEKVDVEQIYQENPLDSVCNSDFSEDDEEIVEDFCTEDYVVDEADAKAVERFMSMERSLTDVLRGKITEKKTEIASMFSNGDAEDTLDLSDVDQRVVDHFRGVGKALQQYRSGKIPKSFKLITKFKHWKKLLQLTEPEKWSAAAMYQATRMFASNMKPHNAQRFYQHVLLPRVRDDISEYKRLNFHLYQALRKAIFKPAAFFKGIILAICEDGITLREAIVLSSLLARQHIPPLHSSAAIYKLAKMEYCGGCSVFMRVLLNKKYALPVAVVDEVVGHFVRFVSIDPPLPVLWHQCLLTFVQRYKEHISADQKEALRLVCKQHRHDSITPEIQRELNTLVCKDEIPQNSTMDII